jgi:CRP/FNR family transcriptional regulator
MLETMSREVPSLHRSLHTVLAQEIVRSQGIMLLLGSMGSRERVAAFLLNLSRRLVRRGCSGTQIQLPMTREEIGSYLGLTIETVSRVFSSLQRDGLMEVRQKDLRNIDITGLERILARNDGASRSPWADVCEPGVY